MGETTIEWTATPKEDGTCTCGYTFNPIRGCTKISPGCKFCYADLLSKRNPGVLGIWGDEGTRVVATEACWKLPEKWNREAEAANERRKVFCASLADIFEDRPEHVPVRLRLFHLINETTHLDWLLLTKRPENIRRFCETPGVPRSWSISISRNIWYGTSVEDRKHGKPRIDVLREIPAALRFLSVEPLLEDLGELNLGGIDWVIVGGESGPKARPMNPDWVRPIRDQCIEAKVAFFFKQWGGWMPFCDPNEVPTGFDQKPVGLLKPDGTLIHPYSHADAPGQQVVRVGKKAAGRLLDGREWSEFPTPSA